MLRYHLGYTLAYRVSCTFGYNRLGYKLDNRLEYKPAHRLRHKLRYSLWYGKRYKFKI